MYQERKTLARGKNLAMFEIFIGIVAAVVVAVAPVLLGNTFLCVVAQNGLGWTSFLFGARFSILNLI